MLGMKPLKHRSVDTLDAFDSAPQPTAVRMGPAIQHRHQCFDGHGAGLSSSCRISVMISPRRRSTSTDGKCRPHHDLPDESQHVVEIFNQAGAREGESMASDRRGERYAAIVQLLGKLVRRLTLRSAVDRARDEMREPLVFRVVVHRAGPEMGEQRHGGCRRGSLGDHRDAVGEDLTRRRQSGHYRIGSKRPTVRLVGLRRSAATLPTSSTVTASICWERVG